MKARSVEAAATAFPVLEARGANCRDTDLLLDALDRANLFLLGERAAELHCNGCFLQCRHEKNRDECPLVASSANSQSAGRTS